MNRRNFLKILGYSAVIAAAPAIPLPIAKAEEVKRGNNFDVSFTRRFHQVFLERFESERVLIRFSKIKEIGEGRSIIIKRPKPYLSTNSPANPS